MATEESTESFEVMECDVLVVGAGPAGLSAAIHLKQRRPDANVILLEKGSEVGAHTLSGAVFEPRALNLLFPDWKERGAPLHTPVTSDAFAFFTEKKRFTLPTPPQMHNAGNYIISLGNLCRWLAAQAEALGVQIFPGFPAAQTIIEDGQVRGVRTGAFGIGKNGERKPSYQPPMELRAKLTLFAEGCRGSLTQKLFESFALRRDCDPQTYGIGIKEIWQVAPEKHTPGAVEHSIGWPLDAGTYGGSFLYHLEDNQVAIGYVIGLDYSNPHLDPFKEFQRFKHHPHIAKLLEGGRRLSYGARAINEGGWQSIPKLTFPGGALIGCGAGFLNVPKIKGSHTAMMSGMLAAEAASGALEHGENSIAAYEEALRTSWVGEELYGVRNLRPAFRYGLWGGLLYAALDTYLLRGKAPWTLRNHPDHTQLKRAADSRKITYPAPDGVLSFDRMSSVYLSNTNHEEDQPCHLTLKDASIPVGHNLPLYDAPEQRYCPAGVYEIVEEAGAKRLQINAQNCVHCKTCDIKDPTQNIVWVTPEGGGGPNYPNM
ncbi:MAG: electron transfer flavoprotein-ubiquinone oxidoreductase [Azospirillum brasilense]|nr:MAG: electron transfer flavoprotein-ubiquinone oxidoreductase [Azospirillum brasilense]